MKAIKIACFLFLIPLLALGQEIDENLLENKHYIERMEYFKANPLKKGQIVFFGNSITEAGKWDTYFPKQQPANRGISGDNTEGMLARMHEVIASKPSKLFIMAGVNDISLQRSNDVIIRQMKMLLRQVKAGNPETKVYVQSSLPLCKAKLAYSRLKGKEIQIENYNTLLKNLCNEMNITYIDIYSLLLEKPLTLNEKYTSDGLHINEEAYKIWVEHIRKYVEEREH